MTTTTRKPSTLRTGTRVEVIAAPTYHPSFVGQSGTVWFADRRGAVVTLDGHRSPDARFVLAQLRAIA